MNRSCQLGTLCMIIRAQRALSCFRSCFPETFLSDFPSAKAGQRAAQTHSLEVDQPVLVWTEVTWFITSLVSCNKEQDGWGSGNTVTQIHILGLSGPGHIWDPKIETTSPWFKLVRAKNGHWFPLYFLPSFFFLFQKLMMSNHIEACWKMSWKQIKITELLYIGMCIGIFMRFSQVIRI